MNLARRTLLLLLLLAAAAGVAAATAAAAPTAEAPDHVWAGGAVHALDVTGPAPANATGVVPLYVIAPIAKSRPLHPLADAKTHGFGAHDHVIGLASFKGACELTLVVPGRNAKLGANVEARPTLTPAGTKPLLFAVRLGGRALPLNSAARIRRAVQEGLAVLVDTHATLACSVRP